MSAIRLFDDEILTAALRRAGVQDGPHRAAPPAASAAPPARPAPSSPPARAPRPTQPDLSRSLAASLAGAGSGLERGLDALLEWITVFTQAEQAFVANAEGLPLATVGTEEAYVAVTSMIAQALSVITGHDAPGVVVDVAPDRVLQLIWIRRPEDSYVLGIVRQAPLSGELVTSVRAALTTVFH